MDGLFNIQLNKSSLVRDNIQKEVIRTINYLNRKFIGKMKTLTEKQQQEAAAAAAATDALASLLPDENHDDDTSGSSEQEQSEDISSSGGDSEEQEQEQERSVDDEPQQHDDVLAPVVALAGSSRVIHVPEHTRETIPQNTGIQILQTLKQQPQYHDAMADTVDTLLADCCRRISDERSGRLMTKRLINLGSFENKCDMLCELLQGIYVLPEDTMRHGAVLHRKYNAVAAAAGAPPE
jgi:hypothetical protein